MEFWGELFFTTVETIWCPYLATPLKGGDGNQGIPLKIQERQEQEEGSYSCYCMRTPDQDMAPAWQRQSATGAGREFLVLYGNDKQEQDIIDMH